MNNKDCIIFLIDSQKSMFIKTENNEIPFYNALKCAISTLTDKIISSENDLIGICLYGTVFFFLKKKIYNFFLIKERKKKFK